MPTGAIYDIITMLCRCDGIGRRSGLKIHRWRQRTGSSPVTGTIKRLGSSECGALTILSGCSAVGSAPALGAGCRRFESCHSDQTLCRLNITFERYFYCYNAFQRVLYRKWVLFLISRNVGFCGRLVVLSVAKNVAKKRGRMPSLFLFNLSFPALAG